MSFPITDLATAQAVVSHLQDRAGRQSVVLREPPPEPSTCCGRGCQGCVWESYYEAVAYWRDEALFELDE